MNEKEFNDQLILLAIQGKVLPQDPNENPASDLLNTISENREKLVKKGIIKKNKTKSIIFKENNHYYEKKGNKEPICIDEEIPFEIPETWEWCRFGYIVDFTLGKTPPRKNPEFWDNPSIPWVSIADMSNERIITTTNEQINDYALEKSFKGNIVPKGTLLMSFKLTIGKVGILNMDATHNEAIISIKPHFDKDNVFRDYLFYILPIISNMGDTKSAVKGKTLNSKSLYNLLIPLPNLNEQHRIIEFLKLLKHYQQYSLELKSTNELFANKFKNLILKKAIQGKLVSQNPNDEPALLLLENIKKVKENLIKDKKIKKNKNESLIYKKDDHYFEKIGNKEPICIDEEIPFEIPETWEWCCMNQYLDVRDGTHDTPKYVKEGIPLVTSKNLKNGSIDFDTAKLISVEDHQQISQRSKVDENDILFAMIGTIGNPVIVSNNKEFSIKNVALFKPYISEINMKYIYYYLTFAQTIMRKNASGAVQSFVSLTVLRNYYIPIPPINEQKRIVDKIETLFLNIEKFY